MLIIDRVHRPWSLHDLFDDGQWCPVCLGSQFTYTEGGEGIYCDKCGARFNVRSAAGDPGVVIDCMGDANGRYASLDLVTRRENPYVFWQVVKSCESGLADRERWCSNTRYRLGYDKIAVDKPVFEIVYQFCHANTAVQLAREEFAGTDESKALVAIKDDPTRSSDERNDAQNTWHTAFYRYQYRDKNLNAWEEKLAGFPRGLYFADQCEKTFDNDGYWLHHCLPKTGETPRVSHPFYACGPR